MLLSGGGSIVERVRVPRLWVLQSHLLVLQTVLVLTDSVTCFQFHFPLLVCFYTAVEVKWLLPIIYSKLSSKE